MKELIKIGKQINMTKDLIKNQLAEIFENEGVFIDSTEDEDINISNFIKDSVQFISIIVAIEEQFNIEIPSDLLILDTFNSFHHLIELINEILTTSI